MRRRRKKSSPIRTLFLWTLSLTLIGWGLWQAFLLRRTLVAPPPGLAATAEPDLAIGSASITQQGAPGGEPWTLATVSSDSRPDPATGTPDPDSLETRNPPLATLLPTPTFDAALSASDLVAQATAALNAGQTLAARFALNEALARTSDESQDDQLRQTLSALNRPVFLGPDILLDDPAARIVEIQPGDNFVTVARAYGLNAAFLHILNPTLDPQNLQPGTGIKIVQGPFQARIIKHASRLDLYARDFYIASFPIDFPEGNLLPLGDYQISRGTKLQLPASGSSLPHAAVKTWIGFLGLESANESVTNGWLFASAGPRGTDTRNRATGIHLSDADLQQLYNTLTESRSHLHVEP